MGTPEEKLATIRLNQLELLLNKEKDPSTELKKRQVYEVIYDGVTYLQSKEIIEKPEPGFVEFLRSNGINAIVSDLKDLGYGKEVESILHPQLPAVIFRKP